MNVKQSYLYSKQTEFSGIDPNQNLITAAPDLLKIAELILEEWEKPTEGVLRGELVARLTQYSDLARQAIKKAKGEL